VKREADMLGHFNALTRKNGLEQVGVIFYGICELTVDY
jgi:hypothetical protein